MLVGENSAGRVAELYGNAGTAGFLIKPAGIGIFELAFHIGDNRTPLGDNGRQVISFSLGDFFLQNGNLVLSGFFPGFLGRFGGDAFYLRLLDFSSRLFVSAVRFSFSAIMVFSKSFVFLSRPF